ncbi:hypothetical protein [Komagataeibacter sp. FNDCR2]|uniref:hypothetical protein n=1 Tax=Komagataeibacter sp. FNDCR2 TaxID=2878682 RepID=UPI001E623836|nr:hypothetical protein [Komagataeibacter sp. FNDCR2]MCE2576043.1 hypothetical protein [Komagataeibacter sp. FNDCR2]
MNDVCIVIIELGQLGQFMCVTVYDRLRHTIRTLRIRIMEARIARTNRRMKRMLKRQEKRRDRVQKWISEL